MAAAEMVVRVRKRCQGWFSSASGADSADEDASASGASGGESRRETRSSSPSSEAVGPPRAIAHAIGAREGVSPGGSKPPPSASAANAVG